MDYLAAFREIKAIVFDIDGVFTDNKILVTEDGQFLRTMNVRDGYAVKRAIQAGIKIGIISGGKSIGTKKEWRFWALPMSIWVLKKNFQS